MFEFDPVTKPSQKPAHNKLKNSASDAKNLSSLKLRTNRSWDGGRTNVDGDNGMLESGVCSPPLWKTTSSTTITSPPRSPPYIRTNYRSLSPTSRAQAIARGQRELMDMVRNLPESCYELSLKDLVEHPLVIARHVVEPTTKTPSPPPEAEAEEEERKIVYRRDRSGKVRKAAQERINGEMGNGGFYLKLGFPIFLGSIKNNNNNKKKKTKKKKNSSESDASGKGSERNWWKKRSSSRSNRSESCGSSVNGGSLKSSSSRSSSTASRYFN